MQACARIGATTRWCSAASRPVLRDRINDAGAVAVITADDQVRGGKQLPLKSIVDEALAWAAASRSSNVLVYKRTGGACNMVAGRDKTGCTTWWPASRPPASPSGSRPSTRCSCSTPRAPPASPRACSTAPAATCCTRPDHEVDLRPEARRRLLVHRRHRLGHRPHLHHLRPAGLLAPPRSSSKACPPTRTPAASGR
jgi:hypothetical protein